MSEKIHFVITGGTIDSFYKGSVDTVIPRENSIIPEYMELLGFNPDSVEFSEICMKDSRQLRPADLERVLRTIEESKQRRFIITHGTYTMPDTARYLEAHLQKEDATVILTGSMIPLQGFSPSDAGFNLGYAISQVRQLPSGVYLCMNGTTFKPAEVAKDMGEGKFYSLFGEGPKRE